MPTQTYRNKNATPSETALRPHIPSRVLVQSLKNLYAKNQMLTAYVTSLHLQTAKTGNRWDDLPALLSRFQLDLVEQAIELQHYSEMERPLPEPHPNGWTTARMERLPDPAKAKKAIGLLLDSTDLLMESYEKALPVAEAQHDHAVLFYLLAGHLVALNGHWQALSARLYPFVQEH